MSSFNGEPSMAPEEEVGGKLTAETGAQPESYTKIECIEKCREQFEGNDALIESCIQNKCS